MDVIRDDASGIGKQPHPVVQALSVVGFLGYLTWLWNTDDRSTAVLGWVVGVGWGLAFLAAFGWLLYTTWRIARWAYRAGNFTPAQATTAALLFFILIVLLAGCSGSPTSPSPQPAPSPTPAPVALAVTDTVTGAPVLGFVHTVNNGRATVSAPGYVTREIGASRTQTDLIPEAGFDLEFYRQLVRGTLDGPARPLRRLGASPNIYLQTAGLTPDNVSALEAAARATVPALTGGSLSVGLFETGPDSRPLQSGWIMVDIIESAEPCGRALTGSSAGHIWLNIATRCRFGGYTIYPGVMAHEIGHALGFWHLDTPGSLMKTGYEALAPSPAERHHGAIAYKRPIGSLDVDRDPVGLAILPSSIIID